MAVDIVHGLAASQKIVSFNRCSTLIGQNGEATPGVSITVPTKDGLVDSLMPLHVTRVQSVEELESLRTSILKEVNGLFEALKGKLEGQNGPVA